MSKFAVSEYPALERWGRWKPMGTTESQREGRLAAQASSSSHIASRCALLCVEDLISSLFQEASR